MIRLAPASPAHIGRIATRMREADKEEALAFGRSPKEGLRLSLRGSVMAATAFSGRDPVAMFGLTPLNALEGIGRPWFVGTDVVARCARELIAEGPAVIAAMHSRFARLENYVSVKNRRAIRMLGAWGFEIGDETMIFGGVEFKPFWRDRDVP